MSLIDSYQRLPPACCEYDPRFPDVAQRLADAIESPLPSVRVEHIGSTAVRGCAGKGVIDLQVLYPQGQLSGVKAVMGEMGFQRQISRDPFPEDRPMRVGTIEHDGECYRIHAHVLCEDDSEVERNRAFRDLLRADPNLRDAYIERKREILAEGEMASTDYAADKAPFIRGVLKDHGVDVPDEIVIRRTTPGDVPAVLSLYNALRPEQPPMTVEEYEGHLRELRGKRYESWVADLNGRIVGDFDIFEAAWYARPDTFKLYGEVDSTYRRQGIGSRLYSTMTYRAREIGASRVYTDVLETDAEALAFLERRGWKRTGLVDRMSRLDVERANLDGFTGVEDRLAREGIRIATLDELGPDNRELLHALHEVEFRSLGDMPSSEPHVQEPFEEWVERQLHGAGKSAKSYWVALGGSRPVGVARLRRREGGAFGNSYTGVDPSYRGRGIARALKLRTIEWVRRQGGRYIYTGNAAENARMLAINRSLGYEPLPGDVELVLDL